MLTFWLRTFEITSTFKEKLNENWLCRLVATGRQTDTQIYTVNVLETKNTLCLSQVRSTLGKRIFKHCAKFIVITFQAIDTWIVK